MPEVLSYMDRRLKGEIAHLKVQLRAAERGYVLSKPTTECRYDFIMDDGTLKRVQVKYAGFGNAKGSVMVDLRRRGCVYKHGEVDLLLVYIPYIDKILALEPEHFCGKPTITLRFSKALNGQVTGLRLIEKFIW